MMTAQPRRRIVHVVYRFGVGGLENVVVQLINCLPADQFEHVVLSLTSVSDFRNRVMQPDVQFIELHKPPGHAIPLYPRIFRLLREVRPDVLHTCNLAALEIAPLAWLARVPLRVHAEHGWDAHDPKGESRRYQQVRKLYKPFVSHYVAVSEEINTYLSRVIGVPVHERSLIANGVDTDHFSPASGSRVAVQGCPFDLEKHWLVGTVGRLQTVKNQPLLARAFVSLLRSHPEAMDRMRLVVVGEGPLRAEIEDILSRAGVRQLAWLAGSRDDVAEILRSLRCFVLPSQAEGTSCTLQEAMASGLPVVATAVGGTSDLVEPNVTGKLVPPDDEAAMADAIWSLFGSAEKAAIFGRMARDRAVKRFRLDDMVARYGQLFSGESVSQEHRPK
ncbi:sugar transferase, PEP-CTERM/EpsH1 system associated [Acidovorax delafieldii 2AN]|uniref:Sugar transferase, PEP-CTERM/EpsH1 system associated n=1 Tax=Acidovorax delafieldii 2AN TaxID=573060 RepID=C5T0U8_ACIDE|nr:TIGR03088 family PEP-CTERM/XrtA system glycosyltransferase [Acidovorax delafieldii]EER61906.1 sugar transferase, PEP-CTERM/EpsH1 system associated [Acidovorax delafieldii 2AN]